MIRFKNAFGVTDSSTKVYSFSKRRSHLVLGTKGPQWPWLLFSNIRIPGSGLLFGEANANFGKPYSMWMILSMHRKAADINADWPRLRGNDLIGQEIKQITKYPPHPRGRKKVLKIDDARHVKWVRKNPPWVSTIYLRNVSLSWYVSAMGNSC